MRESKTNPLQPELSYREMAEALSTNKDRAELDTKKAIALFKEAFLKKYKLEDVLDD